MKNNSVAAVAICNKEGSYEADQYLPLPKGLGICIGNEKQAIREHENILSLSLLTIRVILELLLLIVYLARKGTRKIAEKNLIAFCFVLLVCDSIGVMLPLTKNSLDEICCEIIAVLLHFFSLALCTCSCFIAYEIWFIFGQGIIHKDPPPQKKKKKFLRYSLVACGVPTVLTSICVTGDILGKKSLIPYGRQDFCWISPFHARLAVYIIQFVVMTVGSFVIVFVSMLQRKHERKAIHKILAKNRQVNYSKMLTKLCLLFRTAELVGLVQILDAERKASLR